MTHLLPEKAKSPSVQPLLPSGKEEERGKGKEEKGKGKEERKKISVWLISHTSATVNWLHLKQPGRHQNVAEMGSWKDQPEQGFPNTFELSD